MYKVTTTKIVSVYPLHISTISSISQYIPSILTCLPVKSHYTICLYFFLPKSPFFHDLQGQMTIPFVGSSLFPGETSAFFPVQCPSPWGPVGPRPGSLRTAAGTDHGGEHTASPGTWGTPRRWDRWPIGPNVGVRCFLGRSSRKRWISQLGWWNSKYVHIYIYI